MSKIKNRFCLIDIGSSKFVCMVVKTNGNIEILGHAIVQAKGIKAGIIIDKEAFEKAMLSVVEKAEASAGITIDKVYISISSYHLISKHVSTTIFTKGQEITERDISKLRYQAEMDCKDEAMETVGGFIIDYILDGNRGISNPLGMHGSKLSAEYHFQQIPSSILINLQKCLSSCQLEMKELISSPIASSHALLSEHERLYGALLLEFGGNTSTLSWFSNNNLMHNETLPLGGITITNDIAKVMSLEYQVAERLKDLHGDIEGNGFIESINLDEGESVNLEELCNVIKYRTEEIIELLWERFTHNVGNTNMMPSKIIVTGGTSSLHNIESLISRITAKQADCKRTFNGNGVFQNLPEELQSQAYSTVVGMALFLHKQQQKNKPVAIGVFNWVKRMIIGG